MVNKRTIILLVLVAVIVIFPLALYNGKGEDQGYFGGADDQGPAYISNTTGYQPWFQSLWTPPSGEIESLLFATQAAIGAIIIGYVFGYWSCQAKAKRREEMDKEITTNEPSKNSEAKNN
jgi:cobalt/nickel transport protein